MTTLFAGSTTSVALWIVIKASILLAATVLVQVVLGRRASAATRHGIWTLCLACLIVLPVIATAMPEWPIAIHVTSNPPEAVSMRSSGASLRIRRSARGESTVRKA